MARFILTLAGFILTLAVVAAVIYTLLRLSIGPLGNSPLNTSILGVNSFTTMDAIVLGALVFTVGVSLLLGQRREQNERESDKRRSGGIGSGTVSKKHPSKLRKGRVRATSRLKNLNYLERKVRVLKKEVEAIENTGKYDEKAAELKNKYTKAKEELASHVLKRFRKMNSDERKRYRALLELPATK